MLTDEKGEIHPEVHEFLNDILVASEIEKDGFKRFKYLTLLIDNDFKSEDELLRLTAFNVHNDADREILLSLLFKNKFDLEKVLENSNSKNDINFPKPKQIKEGYFDGFAEQLKLIDSDLRALSRKYNASYIFILYDREQFKFLYKVKKETAMMHCKFFDFCYDCVTSLIYGQDIADAIEAMMREEDEDGIDSNILPDIETDNSLLDKDDEDFENY